MCVYQENEFLVELNAVSQQQSSSGLLQHKKREKENYPNFFSFPAPINLFSFLTINLHNLTLSLIARGFEDSLRSMTVLSGALLSGEAAKLAVSLPSPAFITPGYSEERKTTVRGLP